MLQAIPEVSKQIRSSVIREVIEKNYSSIMPIWAPLQLSWINNVYKTFHDYEKFMIIMSLLLNTFQTYSKNFARINYDEYFSQKEIDIIKSSNKILLLQSVISSKKFLDRNTNDIGHQININFLSII